MSGVTVRFKFPAGSGGVYILLHHVMWKGVWYLYTANPQQGDLRLSGLPSGQGAGGRARIRNRGVAEDLRSDSQPTVPP
ncbi:hypothetical protein PoB_000422000 [Plakobranchus ocellatus]|uniref:Uncharacterized protein n=1 Tax=Plakobranchus ocellatus TaxID=259542 RepID=A0AAV3Y4I7_9GAST|nr:hypothetical protein PoB_000422000 [Plakobranchus ocellatus]